MEQLSWQELSSILLEYEDKHNYDTLKTFAAKYYPAATRVEVKSISEYDDSHYFQTYDQESVRFYDEGGRLERPHDRETLLQLFAVSETLNTEVKEVNPTDPLEWFEEQYYGDFCDLNLYGPERGDDLVLDLTLPFPDPTPVYKQAKGDTHALCSDEQALRV